MKTSPSAQRLIALFCFLSFVYSTGVLQLLVYYIAYLKLKHLPLLAGWLTDWMTVAGEWNGVTRMGVWRIKSGMLDNAQVSLTEIVKLIVHSWKWHLHLHYRLLRVVREPYWSEIKRTKPDGDEQKNTWFCHGNVKWKKMETNKSVLNGFVCFLYVLIIYNVRWFEDERSSSYALKLYNWIRVGIDTKEQLIWI